MATMTMTKKGGFMKDLIIDQIERRARLDHGGDVSKAAEEYFRDYPEEWRRYRDEVNGVNKRAGEDREKVNAEVHYRIEYLSRAGVKEQTAMKITGHKTTAMYRRYNIVDEEEIRKAQEKVQAYLDATRDEKVSIMGAAQ
jgi:hypothetical protein